MRFLDEWYADICGHANKTGAPRKAAKGAPAAGLMILGTDTDVGKSYVSAILIRHLVAQGICVGAYKPVASGVPQPPAPPSGDAVTLLNACQRDWPIKRICPQSFAAALAPPVAAAREQRSVDDALLRSGTQWWRDQCQVLLVESAGGALSPLSSQSTVLDLAVDLGYPVVLVAAHRLGMMSQVLLTLEATRRRDLQVLALVVNSVAAPSALVLATGVTDQVQLDESLACLLPFCGKIDCYRLDYAGSTLFPVT